MLDRELPLDPATPHSIPAVLNRPCDELLAATRRTVSQLLLDSKTDLAVMKALKDYCKALARLAGREARRTAATVIYYAAIANALVFHQHKITQHSYEKLHEAYAELEQKPWIPSELKELFKKAQAICRLGKETPG